jgi:hypothetical protein
MIRLVISVLMLTVAPASGIGSALAEDAGGDAVIIASEGADYSPGTVITEDQSLAVPKAATVTILFRSGQMLKVAGPFEGGLGQARPADAPGGLAGLVAALRSAGVDASAVGATRTLAPSARRALADRSVLVDPRRPATYCLGQEDTIWLLRSDAAEETITALRHGGMRRELYWPEGAARIEWPPEVIIEEGDRFEALDASDRPVAVLAFHRLNAPASDAAWIAQTLLLGCRDQAEPALHELERALGTSGGGKPG